MANRMAEIAKLLGVRLGEVFFIKEYPLDSKIYLKFTENGLEQSLDKDSWTKATGRVWERIITGALKINKLPWKPKYNEKYYIPSISNAFGYNKFYWRGDDSDDKYYNLGLIFKSKEEAIALGQKMLAVAKE